MNYKIIIFSIIVFSFLFSCSGDKSTNSNQDNTESITIGTQVWMKKNLDVDHYRNGDPIPKVVDYRQWDNLKSGAWCYNKNDSTLGATYGRLYNWYALNDHRGLAPQGWHIPSESEWTTLINFLGGENIAGGALKEVGNVHWEDPNIAYNVVGFTALPGGYRDDIGGFKSVGSCCGWWFSTEYDSIEAFRMILDHDFNKIFLDNSDKTCGFSIRCIKD